MVLQSEKSLPRTTVYVNSISAERRSRPRHPSLDRTSPFSTPGSPNDMPRRMNPTKTEKGDVRVSAVPCWAIPLNWAMFWLRSKRGAVTDPTTMPNIDGNGKLARFWQLKTAVCRGARWRGTDDLRASVRGAASAGCPRLVHGADPLRSKRRCGQGVDNPTSTSARGHPSHRSRRRGRHRQPKTAHSAQPALAVGRLRENWQGVADVIHELSTVPIPCDTRGAVDKWCNHQRTTSHSHV